MIEDEELRELFKVESREHIQNIEALLLKAEKVPDDKAVLDEIYRDAHSLKGASRMIGVNNVQTVAHHLEEIIGMARKGELVLSPDIIDRIYRGLDIIKELVKEALTGKSCGLDLEEALNALKIEKGESGHPPVPDEDHQASKDEVKINNGVALKKNPKQLKKPKEESKKEESKKEKEKELKGSSIAESEIIEGGKEEVIPSDKSSEEMILSDLPSEIEEYRIETVRVNTKLLDRLMMQTGELTVTKIRIARRLLEVEELINLHDEMERVSRLIAMNDLERHRFGKMGDLLEKLKERVYEDSSRLDFVANELEDGIRKIRLVPLSSIFNLFPRMVRDMSREQGKEIRLVIEGGDTAADKRIVEEMKDPIMHMIRNAIDHGMEVPDIREEKGKDRLATIRLKASQTASNIVIEVSDDGNGMKIDSIKEMALKHKLCSRESLEKMSLQQLYGIVFSSGFTTSSFVTDLSGRGVGLDVVRSNVERLKGSIKVESTPGEGCFFKVFLPVTLATIRVLIAMENGTPYAIPVANVKTSIMLAKRNIFLIEGRQTITYDKLPVSVSKLSSLLELNVDKENESYQTTCIICEVNDERFGLIVDSLIDEQEVVLKTQSAILKRVRNVMGTTILGSGEVCTVLHPSGLLNSVLKTELTVLPHIPVEEEQKKKVILLAEDSITTRTQEKRILEGAGYEVIIGVDGLDAFNKLGSKRVDAVVSDILMPNMTGLELTARIRENKKYREMPIILVTSLASEEDKKRGIEVGANAYITKDSFDQKVLVDTLKRLV